MQYIKINSTTWVKVDVTNNASQILVKADLEDQKESLEDRLAGYPEVPSDEFLLAWAKTNYPQSVDSTQRAKLSLAIANIDEDLANMV